MAQVAFHLGPLTVTWYGILVAIGFLIGLWTASRRSLRDGISGETVVDLGLWLLVGGLAGARLHHVLAYWREEYAHKPLWEVLAIYHGGLVFHGGLAGASLATVFYCRAKGLPFWRLADVLAPSVPLGHVFGRVGCFVNGCCFGSPTTLPWAVRSPQLLQAGSVGLAPAQVGKDMVHPTQLYEAAVNLALYVGLAWLFRRKRYSGQVFASYLIVYGVARFGVECFRGDYPVRYLGGWATPGHLVSAVVLAAGLLLAQTLGNGAQKSQA